jgi:hypothetical protein
MRSSDINLLIDAAARLLPRHFSDENYRAEFNLLTHMRGSTVSLPVRENSDLTKDEIAYLRQFVTSPHRHALTAAFKAKYENIERPDPWQFARYVKG